MTTPQITYAIYMNDDNGMALLGSKKFDKGTTMRAITLALLDDYWDDRLDCAGVSPVVRICEEDLIED